MSVIDIVIPTYNNRQYLVPCVQSLLYSGGTADLFKVIVVNNGHPDSVKDIAHPDLTILQMKENKGWEGGLKAGLEVSKSPYVVFCNDDILVPPNMKLWPNLMLQHFRFPDCAAVGPSSNCVTGLQSIFAQIPYLIFRSSFLIGFFMMLRRSALDEVGGVDDNLPYHGDDIDLSIRLRKAGKYLVADKEVFIFHHGFKTGQREYKDYWNSAEMSEKTNFHLMNKHGLNEWLSTVRDQFRSDLPKDSDKAGDLETDVTRRYVQGERVLELGCGAKKTVENAIGVDIAPLGGSVPGLFNEISKADVVADVSEELPLEAGTFDTVIARHILEHMIDPVKAIKAWGKPLKHGGRLILALPDQDIHNTIPMNFQHVHAYNKNTIKTFMESLGWKHVATEDCKNFISFASVWEKNGVHA